MSGLKGTKTEKNLLASFAGESQARNRYTFFASQAKKEGYEQISAVFLETAENEREHAKRFFKLLEGGALEITATFPAGVIGKTELNLESSALGENLEHTKLYPEAARIAEEEGFNEIAKVFKLIASVEETHEKRYRELLYNVRNGKVFKKDNIVEWKCRNCGYVHKEKEAPEQCPACLHPKTFYEVKCECYR